MMASARIGLLPVGLLTLVTLALEVFLTRLLAYTVHTLLIYFVLGIALLGFGAAGTLVALKPKWLEPERAPEVVAWGALAFSASIIGTYAVFVRIAPLLPYAVGWAAWLASALLTVPFIAAGVVVTVALSTAGKRLGKMYAVDLLGSGLGCFVPLILLGPVSGERLIGILALGAWVAGVLFSRSVGHRGHLRLAVGATFLLALGSIPGSAQFFPLKPEPYGQIAFLDAFRAKHGFERTRIWDRWNPVGRVGVHELRGIPGGPDPYPVLFYAQDNNAGAAMIQWDGKDKSHPLPPKDAPQVAYFCRETLMAQAYFRERRKVIVIGVGGGADVQCALYNQAQHVDAVEINPDSLAMIQGPFNEHLGGIGNDSRVNYHLRDGRSFAHGQRDASYDLIQLSGVDTKHILPAGALSLSENHLYTREAFVDYLQSLTPEGVLSIVRFGDPEGLRLMNTAVTALRELGEPHPEEHIIVSQAGHAVGLVIRRKPFPSDEVAAYRDLFWNKERPFTGVKIFFLNPFGYTTERPPSPHYTPLASYQARTGEFFQRVRQNDVAAFEAAYEYNIRPVDDDRPFFFDITRYDLPTAAVAPHVPALTWLLTGVVLLAIGLIALPLWFIKGRPKGRTLGATLVYFSGVGLGYLLVEAWLIYRFSMYLGHQSYSLSVVLATLLVSTGIGAVFGERLIPDPRKRSLVGVVALFALLLVGWFAIPAAIEATWNQGIIARAALAIAFVAPAGFVMGFPFPAGLSWVGERFPKALPWCCGINFFASVLASAATIPMALLSGYTTVLLYGVGLYILVAIGALTMRPAET